MKKPPEKLRRCLTAGLAVTLLGCLLASRLAWNLTDSLPRGLYARSLVRSGPHLGDIVAFEVPESVRDLVYGRRYLPPGAQLFKTVVAGPGDHVCTRDSLFEVNHRPVGPVLRADAQGNPLPFFEFCGVVPADSYFVASATPRSFDSRYFGPLRVESLAQLRPLWTY